MYSRRCVDCGYSRDKNDANRRFHMFPVSRPAIVGQWISFVREKHAEWKGPYRKSLLCSAHFTEECYPIRYKIKESMGIENKYRSLCLDAVPTIHLQKSYGRKKRTVSTDRPTETTVSPQLNKRSEKGSKKRKAKNSKNETAKSADSKTKKYTLLAPTKTKITDAEEDEAQNDEQEVCQMSPEIEIDMSGLLDLPIKQEIQMDKPTIHTQVCDNSDPGEPLIPVIKEEPPDISYEQMNEGMYYTTDQNENGEQSMQTDSPSQPFIMRVGDTFHVLENPEDNHSEIAGESFAIKKENLFDTSTLDDENRADLEASTSCGLVRRSRSLLRVKKTKSRSTQTEPTSPIVPPFPGFDLRTTINVGRHYRRWCQVKELLGLHKDETLIGALLDRWFLHQAEMEAKPDWKRSCPDTYKVIPRLHAAYICRIKKQTTESNTTTSATSVASQVASPGLNSTPSTTSTTALASQEVASPGLNSATTSSASPVASHVASPGLNSTPATTSASAVASHVASSGFNSTPTTTSVSAVASHVASPGLNSTPTTTSTTDVASQVVSPRLDSTLTTANSSQVVLPGLSSALNKILAELKTNDYKFTGISERNKDHNYNKPIGISKGRGGWKKICHQTQKEFGQAHMSGGQNDTAMESDLEHNTELGNNNYIRGDTGKEIVNNRKKCIDKELLKDKDAQLVETKQQVILGEEVILSDEVEMTPVIVSDQPILHDELEGIPVILNHEVKQTPVFLNDELEGMSVIISDGLKGEPVVLNNEPKEKTGNQSKKLKGTQVGTKRGRKRACTVTGDPPVTEKEMQLVDEETHSEKKGKFIPNILKRQKQVPVFRTYCIDNPEIANKNRPERKDTFSDLRISEAESSDDSNECSSFQSANINPDLRNTQSRTTVRDSDTKLCSSGPCSADLISGRQSASIHEGDILQTPVLVELSDDMSSSVTGDGQSCVDGHCQLTIRCSDGDLGASQIELEDKSKVENLFDTLEQTLIHNNGHHIVEEGKSSVAKEKNTLTGVNVYQHNSLCFHQLMGNKALQRTEQCTQQEATDVKSPGYKNVCTQQKVEDDTTLKSQNLLVHDQPLNCKNVPESSQGQPVEIKSSYGSSTQQTTDTGIVQEDSISFTLQ